MSSVFEEMAKKKFAELLANNPKNPYECALEIYPDDVASCMKIANEWPRDVFVNQELNKIRSRSNAGRLKMPTRETVATEVLNEAKKDDIDPDAKHKFYKLFCEMMGYIEKPMSTQSATVNNNNNKVMIITNNGSDDNWSERLIKQQQGLLE